MLYLVKKKQVNYFDVIHKTDDMKHDVFGANTSYSSSIEIALKSFNNFVEEFKFEEDTFEEYLNNFVVLAESENAFDIKDLEELFPEYFL